MGLNDFEPKKINITRESRKNNIASSPSRLDCLDELQDCIGLEDVKKTIRTICQSYLFSKRRQEEGKGSLENINYNMVFSGKDGTGKKMVANLVGKIFHSIGLLKTDHVEVFTRSDILGGVDIRQAASESLKRAYGGVLLINNIGTLLTEDANENDVGLSAVDFIINQFIKNQDAFLIIVAGQPNEIARFYDFLDKHRYKSYFKYKVLFSDYTPNELYEILDSFAHTAGYFIDEHKENNAKDALISYFQFVYQHRDDTFDNAFFVQEVWRDIQDNISNNKMMNNLNDDLSDIITIDDIPDKYLMDETAIPDDEELFKDINALVGLNDLKLQLKKTVNYAKLVMNKRKQGIEMDSSFHMVFTGRPGTGKTTVARIIGDIFYKLHFLTKKGADIVELGPRDLVGPFIGGSEEITKRKLKEARGGVFFIDEAYSLTPSDKKSNDFGKKVIDVILKYMEDHRNDMIVIAAGYKDEMEDFLNSNPGLKSRFDQIINFADYSGDELNEIFHRSVKKDGFTIDEGLEKVLPKCFEIMNRLNDTEYANGRGVRTFYQAIRIEYAARIDATDSSAPFTIDDLPKNNPITDILFKEIKL